MQILSETVNNEPLDTYSDMSHLEYMIDGISEVMYCTLYWIIHKDKIY